MKREELIKQCRFYKGEKKNPYEGLDVRGTVWECEGRWVERLLEDKNAFKEHEEIHKEDGLIHFRENENPPLSCKSYLYTRFCYWRGCSIPERDAANFRDWYNKIYK
ncbi:MAG: hypothetical protein LUC26_06095 [Prevotella sp.]|nr:hypothetical protein [Prevotella sp.]